MKFFSYSVADFLLSEIVKEEEYYRIMAQKKKIWKLRPIKRRIKKLENALVLMSNNQIV